MDALGLDVQVLHNTIFIESVSDRPEVEVALCRAWNRWMAEVWKLGQGRLRWVCVPPFHSIPDAIDEIRFGKAHGAVGLQLPPFAGDRLMTDPSFYPLFEEAERLDLAIASHIANATTPKGSTDSSPLLTARLASCLCGASRKGPVRGVGQQISY